MKLDPTMIRYLSREDFRVLTAVEMGMKNHALVPASLIESIADLGRGGAYKAMQNLLKHKLIHHESIPYNGYHLTYLGYDFLALRTFTQRGVLQFVGNQIGVGKEADVFVVADQEEQTYAMKLHRLGRASFRTIKKNRDYLQRRKSASWLYMSRLASLKEFAYMKVLYEHGFPVPKPHDCNRHALIMQLLKATSLSQLRSLSDVPGVYSQCMHLIVKLAHHGLVHCDFNEFNIMIGEDDEKVWFIDFPQMVSVQHPNAEAYFDRDVICIHTFFAKRFNFTGSSHPIFAKDVLAVRQILKLDILVEASGFSKKQDADLEQTMKFRRDGDGTFSEDSEDSEDSGSDSEEPEVEQTTAASTEESLGTAATAAAVPETGTAVPETGTTDPVTEADAGGDDDDSSEDSEGGEGSAKTGKKAKKHRSARKRTSTNKPHNRPSAAASSASRNHTKNRDTRKARREIHEY
eukprot:TRINITY_DN3113_c0_g2_i1.p1 TRINITY_DN3113_c0_g2~~TRINITY_DN3113_c0_g2_i1.p1  ORF type:complete len:462 (+),score=94.20 TRINITY_DN3113_c0_g2_i1:8-1393(+)